MSEPVKEKRLIINRHTFWTIPNILTFLRVLCVPVYMTLIILSAKSEYASKSAALLFSGLGVMIFAALTDIVDGKIARKFKAGTKIGKRVLKYDQGSYIGQCIDPIADKLMHLGAIVALSVAGYLHWVFIILLAARELCMVVIGSLLVNDVNIKANVLGKVASATLSVGIILSFFHIYLVKWFAIGKNFSIDWIIVTIGLILNWSAAVNYAFEVSKQLKQNKIKKELEKLEAEESDGEEIQESEDTKETKE